MIALELVCMIISLMEIQGDYIFGKMDINTAISVTSYGVNKYKFVINPFQAVLKLNKPLFRFIC